MPNDYDQSNIDGSCPWCGFWNTLAIHVDKAPTLECLRCGVSIEGRYDDVGDAYFPIQPEDEATPQPKGEAMTKHWVCIPEDYWREFEKWMYTNGLRLVDGEVAPVPRITGIDPKGPLPPYPHLNNFVPPEGS